MGVVYFFVENNYKKLYKLLCISLVVQLKIESGSRISKTSPDIITHKKNNPVEQDNIVQKEL